MANTEKTVAPRNDFKKEPVFVKATSADRVAHKPGFVRKWFHKDDIKHPSYFGRKLERHQVGDPEVGYCWAEGWTVVKRDEAVGRKRDDDTSGVEGALTHGDLICLETTEENAKVYETYDHLKQAARSKALAAGDNEAYQAADGAGVATYRAKLANANEIGDPRAVLKQ